MKNYILPSAVVLMFALGNCTEEIIKIQKEIVHDTVPKFVDRVFAGTDSTKIPIVVDKPTPSRENKDSIIIQKDTVWAVRVDTLWRYDTLREVVYQYGDTLILWYARDRFSIPQEVMPMYNEFFTECFNRGLSPNGGKVLVLIEKTDAVVQSYSFNYSGQHVIVLNDNLTNSERYLPFYRELSRWQLGKEYSQDPASVLYPFFAANVIRWDNRAQHKLEINEFFQ